MRLLTFITSLTVSIIVLSGCAGAGPKPKDAVKVDTTLPVVEFTKNSLMLDMNEVAFEWKNINDKRVKGIRIYKLSPDSQTKDFEFYRDLDNPYKTHYMDPQITPDTRYSYFFTTFSKDAESNKSEIITLNSLPVLDSVAWLHSIQNMPRSAKIIWRPHTNEKVDSYIIERKSGDDDWEQIANVKGRLNAEYIDEDLKDHYTYYYRIKVHTFDNITSTPSKIVTVITKALPKKVENIIVSTNLPKKIRLRWDNSKNKDFSRYYVYRSRYKESGYELIAKLHNNRFEDKIDEDGAEFYYRISVVDVDGLESKMDHQDILGKTLSQPKAPVELNIKIIDNKIKLTWDRGDSRARSYTVIKKHKSGWFKEDITEFTNIKDREFIDFAIEPSSTYSYQVISIDKYSIKSQPSEAVKIETKESLDKLPKENSPEPAKEQQATPVKSSKSKEVVVPMKDLNINEI